MKINIGIVGYGNLGKAIEQLILLKNNYNLIAIFSRRHISSKDGTFVDGYENIKKYVNKIDVMFLCGGSFDDLEKQTPEILKNFDCINSFDNHKKILSELNKLDKIAKEFRHRLIMSCGWDPGIFSNIRALMYSLSLVPPSVFWGKGISMGHSDAIRRVPHVFDGIEFTLPNKLAIKLARQGRIIGNEVLHYRDCYVVADKKYHRTVERDIKNVPDYFLGQPTNVSFVSENELLKLKLKMSHQGEIISNFKTVQGSKCYLDFKLKIESNPHFTATIMTRYVEAVLNLKDEERCGAFTCLDIPMIYLFDKNKRDEIITKLC